MRWTKRRGGRERGAARWRGGGARWRACFDGGTPATPQGRALQPLSRASTCRASAFEALVEGVEMDLGPRRYETFEDLYEYCIRVASAVGLMCLEIFGYEDPRVADSTRPISASRCSSPTSCATCPGSGRGGASTSRRRTCARFGCTRGRPAARGGARGRRRPVRRGEGAAAASGAARARLLRRAAAALPRGDARRLVAAEIMGAIYRAILDGSSGATTTSSPRRPRSRGRAARSLRATAPGPVPATSCSS